MQLNNNGVYNISSKPNKDGDVVTTTAVSTVTTTEDRDQAGDSWVCRKCSTIFKDDGGRILECEICHIHTCAKCLELTNAQYHTTQREDLMWICSSDCRMLLARALGMKDLMKISEELVNRFDHLEKKLANLEGKVEDAKTNASKPLTNETISNIGEQTAKEIMKELDKSAKADPEQETETPTISWAQIAAKNITDQTEQLTNVVVNKVDQLMKRKLKQGCFCRPTIV